MRAPALLGNVDHRPSENAHQRVDVVAAALGFVVGQQPQADGLQCPHTAFDNSLDETGAGAEIVCTAELLRWPASAAMSRSGTSRPRSAMSRSAVSSSALRVVCGHVASLSAWTTA